MTTDEGMAAAAEASVVVRQLRELTAWVGEGRKLTQAGNLTMTDARALVELLGTGDQIDPVVGDRVFKTRSSAELGGLSVIVAWAKEAGLLRVVKGRIVPVKKNKALLDDPVRLWERAFDAFARLGGVICITNFGPALMAEEFPTVATRVLAQMYAGPVEVDDLYEDAWQWVTMPYVLDYVPAEHLRTARSLNDSDLVGILRWLENLGAMRLTWADDKPKRAELTPLALRVLRQARGAPEPGDTIYQVKVTLRHSAEPTVWRRLLVPANIPLSRVHTVIQAAMGWDDSHLHAFTIGKSRYGSQLDGDTPSDDEVVLSEVATRVGAKLEYEYDFGDGWIHDLVVEKVHQAEADAQYPACTDGAGQCPPEDCGGIPGYALLREVLADSGHADHDELLDWLGLDAAKDFDPAAFDVTRVNRVVALA